MIRKTMTVQLTAEQVVRPVAMFVQVAGQFASRIYVESSDMRINAKSIMGMMTLGMETGQELTVSADGPDEEEALARLETFLATGA